MLRADRDRVRECMRTMSPARLREAIEAVLVLDAEADIAAKASGEQERDGWFADGVDTAAARIYQTLVGDPG